MVDALFLWITFVLFINNSKGENGCKHFEYLECIPDKTLVGHVIKTLKVITPGLAQCQSMCYAEPEAKCISYNLGPEESHVRTCELNRFDHLTSPKQLKPTEKTGYHYCPIKNACSSNLCQNNGSLCMPDFYRNSYKCVSGFWAAWGTWSSHCSLPRKRKRVCANPLTQAQAPLSECGKEDGSEEQISPPKDCVSHESLGMKDERIIPNGNFGASTYANSPCLPHFARLDSKGWCAARRQTGESVWVDLNAVKTITKISMRGRDGNDQRPTEFTLAFRKTSLDQWAGYFGGPQEKSSCSGPMTFFHNVTSRYAIVTSNLPSPIIARFVKVIVIKWYDNPSLRFDLLGC